MNYKYTVEAYDPSGGFLASWELGERGLSLCVQERTIKSVTSAEAELKIEGRGSDGVNITNVIGARIYLRQKPLLKGELQKWNVGEELRFWDYTLKLKSEVDSLVEITLAPATLTVRPGENAKCEVELKYTGRENLQVALKISDFPEGWAACEPRRVKLNEAQKTAHLTLTISVPKTVRQESDYNVTVTAVDEQNKRELGNEIANWRVIPVSRLEILPVVRRRRFRAGYKVSLRNARSRTLECTLTGQCEADELNELELLFAKEKEKNLVVVPLELKPGEEKTVNLKIKSPARWTGGDRRHNFSLLAQPEAQGFDDAPETISASGEFVHRQVITWIEGIIVLALLVLLGVLIWWSGNPRFEPITVSPSEPKAKEAITISWSAPNAKTVKITQPIQREFSGEQGRYTFERGFEKETEVRLTATNWIGSVSQPIVIPVTPIGPADLVIQFQASAETIDYGDELTLNWNVPLAKRCDLLPKGVVSCASSLVLKPEKTSEYTLTAYGSDNQSTSQKIAVKVKPVIAEFQVATKNTKGELFEQGQSVPFIWRVNDGSKTDVRLRVGDQEIVLGDKKGNSSICLDKVGNAKLTLIAIGEGGEAERVKEVKIDECSASKKAKCVIGKTGIGKILGKCPCNCPKEK